jgi:uncharacterized damage-inducible protein DinB
MHVDSALSRRQSALIHRNLEALRQASSLLHELDDETFRATPCGLGPLRVSSHLRHVIEFYECFLDGLERAHIDYDARQRDESLERSTGHAARRIEEIIERMQSHPRLRSDAALSVRIEDSGAQEFEDPFLPSSVSRELMTLFSHTIHHFALIATTLRALGQEPGSEFGVALSTLRYQAAQRKAAA